MKINIIKSISILGAFLALSSFAQAQATNWTGAVSDDWNNASNWSNGIPRSGTAPSINSGSNNPVITAGISYNYNSVNIYNAKSLTITNGASVGFTNVYLNSDSTSLIVTDGARLALDSSVSMITAVDSHVIVSNGASIVGSLSGGCEIRGNLTIAGGTLTAGNVYMHYGSSNNSLEFILSTDSVSKISANLTLNSSYTSLTLDFEDMSSIVGGETFDIIDGTITGTFTTINLATLAEGLSWDLSQLYRNGVVSIAGTIIPEPSTYAAIFGALALAFAIYRRRK